MLHAGRRRGGGARARVRALRARRRGADAHDPARLRPERDHPARRDQPRPVLVAGLLRALDARGVHGPRRGPGGRQPPDPAPAPARARRRRRGDADRHRRRGLQGRQADEARLRPRPEARHLRRRWRGGPRPVPRARRQARAARGGLHGRAGARRERHRRGRDRLRRPRRGPAPVRPRRAHQRDPGPRVPLRRRGH